MPDLSTLLLVYATGVLIGVAATDARPAPRVGLALLWPVGPAAFVVTLAVLAAASMIAFPIIGVVVIGAALAWWVM
jgi:hypothetical protein